jgi:hypothetical protein
LRGGCPFGFDGERRLGRTGHSKRLFFWRTIFRKELMKPGPIGLREVNDRQSSGTEPICEKPAHEVRRTYPTAALRYWVQKKLGRPS